MYSTKKETELVQFGEYGGVARSTGYTDIDREGEELEMDDNYESVETTVGMEEANEIIDDGDLQFDEGDVEEEDQELLDVSDIEQDDEGLPRNDDGEDGVTENEIEEFDDEVVGVDTDAVYEIGKSESDDEIEVISDEENSETNPEEPSEEVDGGVEGEPEHIGVPELEEGQNINISLEDARNVDVSVEEKEQSTNNSLEVGRNLDVSVVTVNENEKALLGDVHEHEDESAVEFLDNVAATGEEKEEEVEGKRKEDEQNQLGSNLDQIDHDHVQQDAYLSKEVDLHTIPPIILTIENTEFLLLQSNDESVAHLVALYYDLDILNLSLEAFFHRLRSNEDLEEIHQFQESEETILETSELGGLKITEDNIYSREITILDLVQTFKGLRNCLKDSQCPLHLSVNISFQPRFITRFNRLSELIRRGKGFSHVEVDIAGVSKRINSEDNELLAAKRMKHGI